MNLPFKNLFLYFNHTQTEIGHHVVDTPKVLMDNIWEPPVWSRGAFVFSVMSYLISASIKNLPRCMTAWRRDAHSEELSTHSKVVLAVGERTGQTEKGLLSVSAETTGTRLFRRTEPVQVSTQGSLRAGGLGWLPWQGWGTDGERRFQMVYWDYPHSTPPTPHPHPAPRTARDYCLNYFLA